MTIQRHVLVALAGLALVAVNAAPCAADNITYSVSDSTPPGIPFKAVHGVITLDGTLGVVTTANIVDWTLVIQDPFQSVTLLPSARCPFPIFFTCLDSTAFITGSSVVATSDALWFYNQDNGRMGIIGSLAIPNFWWTLSIVNGEINHFFMTEMSYPDITSSYSQQSDKFQIGSVVPEPSTFWLLGSALVAGGIRRYRRA